VEIDDGISAYLLQLHGAKKPNTIRNYGYVLGWFSRFAASKGVYHLTEITETLLRQAVAEALASDTAPNNRGGEGLARMVVYAVRGLVRWLMAEGVSMPSVDRVKAPKQPERIQQRLGLGEFDAMEQSIYRRLIDHRAAKWVIARDLALLNFCSDTALRAYELSALNVGNVNLETGVIAVEVQKGWKHRFVNIFDPESRDGGPTIKMLRDYLEYRALEPHGADDDAPLWVGLKGGRLSEQGIRRVLKRICEDAGIDGNRPPHAIRRSSFTDAYKANPLALPVLVARMGWSPKSRDLVATYTRGAELEIAGDTQMPLMSKQWRGAARSQRPPIPIASKQRGTERPRLSREAQ